jgi:hypothetical protein
MSIRFTCPHCGLVTEVGDQYAGQSGPCRQCSEPITIPPAGTGASPRDYGAPPPKSSMSTGMLVFIILGACGVVVVVCGGILVALMLPAIQAAREAARRTQCVNNLRQISVAVQSYQNEHGAFPPAYVADKNGKPMHSWRVLLLPYIDPNLYSQYKMEEPWDSPHNKTLALQMPQIFHCPDDPMRPGVTSYAMLVGPHAISDGPNGRKVSEITDGLSNTIAIVESSHSNINWLDPRDVDLGQFGNAPVDLQSAGVSSSHPGVVDAAFADGSVHCLRKDIDPEQFKALTTIDGGEPINNADF